MTAPIAGNEIARGRYVWQFYTHLIYSRLVVLLLNRKLEASIGSLVVYDNLFKESSTK